MKLVIFDVDGTLVDSQDLIVAAQREAFARHGLEPPSRKRSLSVVGLSLPQAFAALVGPNGPVDDLVGSYREAFARLRVDPAYFEPLFRGAADLLAELRGNGIALGIATGKSRRGVEHLVSRHQWDQLFATIQTADDAPSKPDPTMLRQAMTALGEAETRDHLWLMADKLIRSWFPEDEPAPRDPIKAAQEAMRPPRLKRFYARAGVEERGGAFMLTLDGRTARTPARNPTEVPSRALAEALAAEWDVQGAELDLSTMPLTRLVNSAIDGVRVAPAEVVDDIVKYACSDLVCYRAAEPARLVDEQAASWDPILAWSRDELGASFLLAEGVSFVTQPDTAVAKVRARVEAVASPFRLAALHVMTALTGSALIALAHVDGRLPAEDAWTAAHADERYQESVWGRDHEALQRRARREAEFMAASRLYALTR